MAFDDLTLNRPPAPRRPPPRPSQSHWVILAAGIVIVGTGLVIWWMAHAQPPELPLAPTSPTEAARPPVRPNPQPMQLPALADSDTMLRDLVVLLSKHPLLTRLLAQRAPVRAATLAVVQIGDGRTPAAPLVTLRPLERLSVTASGRLDAASYARWDAAARALTSISATDAAQVYVNVKPLFDEAYRELGYPDGNFDDAIVRAIRMLVATPAITADPVLIARPAYFEHADAALRDLPPVQKQLMLAGPENRTRILTWMRTFAAALDLKID